jgi:hypothetical protein
VVEQWGRPAASSSYLSIARRHDEFVDILAGMPELWQRLLVDHVPHPGGKRCRACTVPGTGSPGAPWPCSIRDAAEAARARSGQACAVRRRCDDSVVAYSARFRAIRESSTPVE